MPRRKKSSLEVVIASSNEGKIREIVEIFSDLPVTLLTKEDVEVWPEDSEMEETGASYLDNSLIKARAVVAATGKAALADDSGLEVDALDGGPGVRSARFAGAEASDQANNALLASLLSGVEKRSARYRCVAVLVFPDGRELADWGECRGTIAKEPRGTGGFGYDPWFVPDGGSRTMAELPAEEKHAISHRGHALRGLAAKLRELLDASGGSLGPDL